MDEAYRIRPDSLHHQINEGFVQHAIYWLAVHWILDRERIFNKFFKWFVWQYYCAIRCVMTFVDRSKKGCLPLCNVCCLPVLKFVWNSFTKCVITFVLEVLGQSKVEEHRVKTAPQNKVVPSDRQGKAKEWGREDRMIAVSPEGKTMSVGLDYQDASPKPPTDFSGADFSDTPGPKQPLPRGDVPESKEEPVNPMLLEK